MIYIKMHNVIVEGVVYMKNLCEYSKNESLSAD